MADASRLPAAALGATQRRRSLMEGEPLPHDGVVTPLDARDQSRFERDATVDVCQALATLSLVSPGLARRMLPAAPQRHLASGSRKQPAARGFG
jgi:hypothetical protein